MADEKQEKKVDNVKKKQDKDQKIQELTDLLQRLQADFQNYKKREERNKAEFIKCAAKDLIIKLLPIIDNFELALKNKQSHEDFLKGVELIYAQLVSALEEEGVKPIGALNKKFDPSIHEALLTEKREDIDPDTVVEELQKGYMIDEKVLRTTKVKVSKK